MENLNALKTQINLTLLRDLIIFILDTTKADHAHVEAVRSRCIIPLNRKGGEDFQGKYGFLYLGELLERFEERFGMAVPELRAILLALAYTKDLTPDDMFVGTQRTDFLQKVRRAADGDTYLTGALYLLQEGQSGSVELETALVQKPYQHTEELLFTLSLFTEKQDLFQRFKPLLLRLLGKEHSISPMENMELFVWLIQWLRPQLKQFCTKDMALFRALCALPASFVKEGGRYYQILSDAGYTPLEIAYANMMAVWLCPKGPGLNCDSVVTEKIAVNLFRQVLCAESSLSPDVYEQLNTLFARYKNFSIKCYGCQHLLNALEGSVSIRNLETFCWFSTLAPLSHSAFQSFDILDPHWDALSTMMEPLMYTRLFEDRLNSGMSAEDIKARIARFDSLTGQDYLAGYFTGTEQDCFSLMVEKNILDLWDIFQNTLEGEKAAVRIEIMSRLRSYLRGVRTLQAFHFFEQFLPQYGSRGLKKYFDNANLVADAFTTSSSLYSSDRHVTFQMDQRYLDDEKRRLVLHWLSEYFFQERVDCYLHFVLALLTSDDASRLYPVEERRALYDLVMTDEQLTRGRRDALKRIYQTEQEKEAERLAEEARKQENAIQEKAALVRRVQEKFEDISDGTMSSLLKFLKDSRYHHQEEPIALDIVYRRLKSQMAGSLPEGSECECLLELCVKLMKGKVMRFSEAQQIIDSVKEVSNDGTNDPVDSAG